VHNFDSPAESQPSPRIQKTRPYFERLDAEEPEPAAPPAAREGLPPSYRMRADPHYVDLLASRTSGGRERTLAIRAIDAPPTEDPATLTTLIESVKRHGVLQPLLIQERGGAFILIAGRKRLSAAVAAGLRDVPCLLFDVDDAEAARLAEEANCTVKAPDVRVQPPDTTLHAGADLSQSFATLTACADLLAGAPSDLSRSVMGDLIRAEVWRAAALLHATRIVRQELPVVRAATAVSRVLERVTMGFLPERQVRALTLHAASSSPNGTLIAADERMLVTALSGAVLATIAVLGNVKDASITLAATSEPAGHVTFFVAQEIASVPEIWASRAFDQTWTDRLGGVPAMMFLLAVRCMADAHGGSATVAATNRGTRIALTLPTGL
jgi:hypothetical protein